MEASDYLYRMRNDFYLGRFLEVLEGYKDYKSSKHLNNEFHAEFEINLLLFKTLITFLKNAEDVVKENEPLFSSMGQWMDLFLKYYAPTLMNISEEEGVELLDDLTNESKLNFCSDEEFEELKNILANYINFAIRMFSSLTPISKTFKESYMEYQSIVFSSFEINRQYKDADKIIEDLRLINDEHVITSLLTIRREVRNQRFDQAIELLNETQEMFGSSLKIANIRCSILLGTLRFEEVS
jgi:hypothetical protein